MVEIFSDDNSGWDDVVSVAAVDSSDDVGGTGALKKALTALVFVTCSIQAAPATAPTLTSVQFSTSLEKPATSVPSQS